MKLMMDVIMKDSYSDLELKKKLVEFKSGQSIFYFSVS